MPRKRGEGAQARATRPAGRVREASSSAENQQHAGPHVLPSPKRATPTRAACNSGAAFTRGKASGLTARKPRPAPTC
eukprot:9904056-Alexandrium_andersonii.AAC.1